MEVVAAAVSGGLHVDRKAGGGVRQLFDPVIEVAGLLEPPDHVMVPDPARQPPGAAAG
jgi:hypothetical protein